MSIFALTADLIMIRNNIISILVCNMGAGFGLDPAFSTLPEGTRERVGELVVDYFIETLKQELK